jgi:hypothetical protein
VAAAALSRLGASVDYFAIEARYRSLRCIVVGSPGGCFFVLPIEAWFHTLDSCVIESPLSQVTLPLMRNCFFGGAMDAVFLLQRGHGDWLVADSRDNRRSRTRPGSMTEKWPAQLLRAMIRSARRCPTSSGPVHRNAKQDAASRWQGYRPCQFAKIFAEGEENSPFPCRPRQYVGVARARCCRPDPQYVVSGGSQSGYRSAGEIPISEEPHIRRRLGRPSPSSTNPARKQSTRLCRHG